MKGAPRGILLKWHRWLVIGFFFIVSAIFFRSYLFKSFVPLPFNLLVSFYSPWKYDFLSDYPGGIPNKPMGTDIPKLFYPYRKFTMDELKLGRFPLWNPYVFAGNVHLATYQSAVFYPLNIIYFLLPLVDAWSILVVIQPILAGWFMYLFLQTQLLSRRASLFGAISFAFSGWMIAWWEESIVIEHSILWLPLALYASTLLWRQVHWRKAFLIFVISLTFSLLAGFLQMTLYLFAAVASWNIYLWFTQKDRSKRKKITRLVTLAFAISILVTAIAWVPAFEAYLLSPRGTVQSAFLFERFLVPLRHLVTFFAPDFWGNPGAYNYFFPEIFYHEKVIYLGVFPILFALSTFFKKRRSQSTFWQLFSVITLSLGFALPTSWIWYSLRVPILSAVQPSRIFVLSSFGLSVLAAYGLENFLGDKSRRWVIVPIVILTILAFGLWGFVLLMWGIHHNYDIFLSRCLALQIPWLSTSCSGTQQYAVRMLIESYATISLRNLVLPTFLLFVSWCGVFVLWQKKTVLYSLVIASTLLSSLYFSDKFLYFSNQAFEFPQTPPIKKLKELAGNNRVWFYGNAYIEKNIPSYFGLYSAEGYDALFSRRYGQLLYTIKNNGVITDQIQRTDVDLMGATEKEPLSQNRYRLRLMSLLGVTYILEAKVGDDKDFLTMSMRFPQELFTQVWEDNTWRIWKYTDALPRAFLASRYTLERNRQNIADRILDPSYNLKESIILEEEPEFTQRQAIERSNDNQKVTIKLYQPSRVEIDVETPEPGFLFLSDNFYPGWKAYVDNNETKIYRANYSFRSVPVSSGHHTVTFVYRPHSFFVGGAGSLLGVVTLILFIWRVRKVQ